MTLVQHLHTFFFFLPSLPIFSLESYDTHPNSIINLEICLTRDKNKVTHVYILNKIKYCVAYPFTLAFTTFSKQYSIFLFVSSLSHTFSTSYNIYGFPLILSLPYDNQKQKQRVPISFLSIPR